jgi:riboflavin biosynthesis pyrimidine reductase
MDSLIAINKPFNVRKYNCSDFILSGACYITDRKIRAKEFIPFSFSTTPNRLFKKLRALTETDVIVDPGKKVNGLFFKERVVDMLLSGMMAKRRIITGNTHNNQ